VGLIAGHRIDDRLGHGFQGSRNSRRSWCRSSSNWSQRVWGIVKEVEHESGSQHHMGAQDPDDEEQRELRVPQSWSQHGNQNRAREQGGGDHQDPLQQGDLWGINKH